jgi:hypothetical protein
MRRTAIILSFALSAACGVAIAQLSPDAATPNAPLLQAGPESSKVRVPPAPSSRFLPLDVTLDANSPLAAWQFSLTCDDPAVRIVGLEGSSHPAYSDAPYYDPAAMRTNRVIAAAFSTLDPAALPTAKLRVATVHVMIPAGSTPTFTLTLTAAADPAGAKLATATATLTEGTAR